jgi:hypothetical protein
MRRQSRVSASHVPLMALWKKPQVTAHLVQRVSMLAQRLLSLSRGCAVMSQQQMQAWRKRLWPNLRTQERLHLHAFAEKEQTVTLRALLTLDCAELTLLRYPLRDSLHREATLCQR